VSRAQAIATIRSQIFGSALMLLVLGFGLFFDYLAERLDGIPPPPPTVARAST
jgi:hypothetical protein